MVTTMYDEQCQALMDEFPGFQVWVDYLPKDQGINHWHARQAGWELKDMIHARDAENMHRELTIWTKENANHE